MTRRQRPPQRPDKPGNHEANLRMERKDAETNQRLILAVIQEHERGAVEIAAMVGIAAQTVRRHMRFMHKQGRVHIKRRYRTHIKFDPLWLAGPGEDAPIPERIDNAERMRRARLKRQIDPEAAIQRRSELVRHGLKRRAPRADPAAAWINSGV